VAIPRILPLLRHRIIRATRGIARRRMMRRKKRMRKMRRRRRTRYSLLHLPPPLLSPLSSAPLSPSDHLLRLRSILTAE